MELFEGMQARQEIINHTCHPVATTYYTRTNLLMSSIAAACSPKNSTGLTRSLSSILTVYRLLSLLFSSSSLYQSFQPSTRENVACMYFLLLDAIGFFHHRSSF